jgi:hypothetical protein
LTSLEKHLNPAHPGSSAFVTGFRGQSATVQMRNIGGVRYADGSQHDAELHRPMPLRWSMRHSREAIVFMKAVVCDHVFPALGNYY